MVSSDYDPTFLHEEEFDVTGMYSATPGNGKPMSELEFHERTQKVAIGLLNDVSHESGKLRHGTDPIRVEKALATARAVIESIRRARKELQKQYEQGLFEKAVAYAAESLPYEQQKTFLQALEHAINNPEEAFKKEAA